MKSKLISRCDNKPLNQRNSTLELVDNLIFSPGRTLQEPLCVCVSVYLCVYLCVCSPFSDWSTKPLPRPAWRLLLISCSIQTTDQVHYKRTVYRGWIKRPRNCSKQSACSAVPQKAPDSPGLLLDFSCLLNRRRQDRQDRK